LGSWGWNVATCASAEQGLKLLGNSERRPDLIISDCRLADGKSGIDAIGQLRRACKAPIPALLISGDTGPEQRREAKAGGYLLLRKPVSPMALRTTLGRILRAGEPGRPPPLPADW
jgi:CheY-like chemotaxis protein